MAEHNILGIEGEKLAKHFLIQRGYQIVETNWRSGRYELDIVARDEDTLVIVEVKTRSNRCFALPEDAVNLQKIRRIVRATNHYLSIFDTDLSVRFDIITVVISPSGNQLEHIPDAFYPPLG